MPLWNRLVGSTPLRPGPDQRQQTRIWTAILAMLSALLLTLHIGITDMCTGRGPQFPQLAAYGMTVTLIGLAASGRLMGGGTNPSSWVSPSAARSSQHWRTACPVRP